MTDVLYTLFLLFISVQIFPKFGNFSNLKKGARDLYIHIQQILHMLSVAYNS